MAFLLNIKKYIMRMRGRALAAAASVALLAAAVLSLDAYISLSFPEKRLQSVIALFFMENFGKAVKLEDARMSLLGNITVSNLNISAYGDFNDNISLVKSEKTKIELDFISLLRKEVRVEEVVFHDAEVTLVKKYGRSYAEFAGEFFGTGRPLGKMSSVDFNDFSLSMRGGKLYYIEGFRDDRVTVECRRISASIDFHDGDISYSLGGTVVPYKSGEISRGRFAVRGTMSLKRLGRVDFSSASVSLDSFDLSYLNAALAERIRQPVFVSGGVSAEVMINTVRNDIGVEGTVDLDNLNLLALSGQRSRSVVANENLAIELGVDIIGGRKAAVRRLRLKGSALDVGLCGALAWGAEERYFDAGIDIREIDLTRLSDFFTPWKDILYGGTVRGEGRCHADLAHGSVKSVYATLRLEDFEVRRKKKDRTEDVLSRANLSLDVDGNALDLRLRASRGVTECEARVRSLVTGWLPFRAASDVRITSPRFEAEVLAGIVARGIGALYDEGNRDKTVGYEELFFLQKPLGAFVNGNDIAVVAEMENVLLGGRPGWRGFHLAADLAEGILKIQGFRLNGFDGEYSLDGFGYLCSDHPSLRLQGSVKNLNLQKACAGLCDGESVRGMLSADLDYEMNGYRLAHFIDNAKMTLNVAVESGYLRGTDVQKRLGAFLRNNGFANITLDECNLQRAAFSISQQGENFHVGSLSVASDVLNLAAYGTYTFAGGMRVPLTATFSAKNPDAGSPVIVNIPCMVAGPLSAPVLRLTGIKKGPEFLFFDVD